VLSRDTYIMSNLEKILNILENQCHDEESYIFLGAIAVFSAIGDVAIDSVLPRLRQIYLNVVVYLLGIVKKR